MPATEHPRVIGIHGTHEQQMITHDALTLALSGAARAGAATDLLDLSELMLPLYNPDYPEPREAAVVTCHVSQADAVLLATSVRHDSYSARLKNALEYCGIDEFDGKPVGLLGVTDGSDPTTALNQLRTICATLDARVLTRQVSIRADATEAHDELPTDCSTELQTLGLHVVDRILYGRE